MNWGAILPLAVWFASAAALAALALLIIATARYRRPRPYTWPTGRPLDGIVYAFGKGMMPWEKESVAKHPITFAAGIMYHLGIALAFLSLYLHLLSLSIPNGLDQFLRLGILAGIASGIGLFFKRVFKAKLRRLSVPDDFLANLLVDGFLVLTLLHEIKLIADTLWLTAAVLLLFYIPIGKIRHCFFFFYTRILFGIFFGRRGVYPGPKARGQHHV